MTQVLYSERIGKQGKIRLGCSAAILDEHGRVLLTRRADNGLGVCRAEAWSRASLRRRRVKGKF